MNKLPSTPGQPSLPASLPLQQGLTASLFGDEDWGLASSVPPNQTTPARNAPAEAAPGRRVAALDPRDAARLVGQAPAAALTPAPQETTEISPDSVPDNLPDKAPDESLALGSERTAQSRARWLNDPLGAFGAWLAEPQANAGRGFSAESKKVYAAMWGKFTRFCVDRGTTPALASQGVLEAFVQSLSQERASKASTASGTQAARAQDNGGAGRQARRYLSVIARVQTLLVLLDVRPDNPAAGLLEHCAPEPQRPDPSPLRQGGDQRLRTALVRRKAFDWRDLRDQAIVEVLVGSGMTSRQLRLLRDDPSHLGLDDAPAWVSPVAARRGQPRPARLPLSREAAASLRAWLAQRRERIPGDVLFPATLGGDVMSPASLYRAVSQALLLAQEREDLPAAAHLGPRTLRHTFATRQLRAGKPLEVLQQWLGHRNPSSTAVYKRLVPDPQGHEPA